MQFSPSVRPSDAPAAMALPAEPSTGTSTGTSIDPSTGTVWTEIEAGDGAAELYLYDRTYQVIGSGAGKLALPLVPGAYRLRQRVGDTTSTQAFAVPEDRERFTFVAEPLHFATPLPIEGTALYRPLPDVISPAGLVAIEEPLRIVVRAPDAEAMAHLRAEVRKLAIRGVGSETRQDIWTAGTLDEQGGYFQARFELDPGAYVLMRDGEDGRTACMAIHVVAGLTVQVCLLALRDLQSGQGIPISLDSAAIVYNEAGVSINRHSLLQLEAARKALGTGHAISGWDPAGNPMLALIEAQLRPHQPARKPRGDAPIELASEIFGWNFPDVIAYYCARPEHPWITGHPPSIEGPPLLRRSWDRLIRDDRSPQPLRQLMPARYVVEPTSTWFVWSVENQAAHAAGEGPYATPEPRAGASMLSRMAAASVDLFGQLASRIRPPAPPTGTLPATFDEGVAALVRLHERGELEPWLDGMQRIAAKVAPTHARLLQDPAVQQLLGSLPVLLDPAVVRAFGVEKLARQVLAGLRLPDDQVISLLREIATFVIEQGTRARIRDVVRLVVDEDDVEAVPAAEADPKLGRLAREVERDE